MAGHFNGAIKTGRVRQAGRVGLYSRSVPFNVYLGRDHANVHGKWSWYPERTADTFAVDCAEELWLAIAVKNDSGNGTGPPLAHLSMSSYVRRVLTSITPVGNVEFGNVYDNTLRPFPFQSVFIHYTVKEKNNNYLIASCTPVSSAYAIS